MEGPVLNPSQWVEGEVGSILSLMLSLGWCYGLFLTPRVCSICLSVSLLVVCLTFALRAQGEQSAER